MTIVFTETLFVDTFGFTGSTQFTTPPDPLSCQDLGTCIDINVDVDPEDPVTDPGTDDDDEDP